MDIDSLRAVTPPTPGHVNPTYVGIMALGLGIAGPQFAHFTFTDLCRQPIFKTIISLALSQNASDPTLLESPTTSQLVQMQLLYRAAFGNATAEEVPHLVDTQLDHSDGFPAMMVSWTILVGATTLFVIARIISKLHFLTGWLGTDDWLIIAAWVLLIGPTITFLVEIHNSGGIRHIWDVDHIWATKQAKLDFVLWIFQTVIFWFIKMSFLVFYKTLSRIRWQWIMCYFAAAFTTVGSLILVFMVIFQCVPPASFWTEGPYVNPLAGNRKCLSSANLLLAGSVFSMVTDFMILLIPLSIISKLQLNLKKKISILGLFMVGLVCCVFSVIRIQRSLQVTSSNVTGAQSDPTGAQVDLGVWPMLETEVGIMASCLPAIRGAVVKIYERLEEKFVFTWNSTTTTDSNWSGKKKPSMSVSGHERNGSTHSLEQLRGGGNHGSKKGVDNEVGVQVTLNSRTTRNSNGYDLDQHWVGNSETRRGGSAGEDIV